MPYVRAQENRAPNDIWEDLEREELMKLTVSSSPHIFARQDTSSIMRDVLIALMPAAAFGVYLFGLRALALLCISTAAAILTEYIILKLFKRPGSITDLSAAVTGLLLGMNLPPTAPWWIAAAGGVFAIAIVKQPFGGLGSNFMNPALAARGFLVASWPVIMTAGFVAPHAVDAVSSATPMMLLKAGQLDIQSNLWNMAWGNVGGCIGETSAIALLIGGIYLLVRRIIRWHIPLSYIATVFVMSLLLGGFDVMLSLAHVLGGGLMLGAIFMATDYSTSPVTPRGQLMMGIGCGILTVVIRMYGGYPEGVSYSILLMNIVVPLFDRFTKPRIYGEVRRNA